MQISKTITLAACFTVLLSSQAALAAKPNARTAASIVASAESKAGKSKKNVLLLFHASWCSWCHKLDDFLKRPDIEPIMDANYVTIHVVVQESEDKKDLDNPGGDALLEKLGGKDQGIPYYAVLSPTNKTLAVSTNEKGENIGYPGSKNEIALFMKMLTSTAPHLTQADASLIETQLVEAGKKIDADQALNVKLYTPIRDALKSKDYSAVLSGSQDIIAKHPDLAGAAYIYRYEALLHVDEPKALSEIEAPLGASKGKAAGGQRASLIVGEEGLSDRAYQTALAILLRNHADTSAMWYQQSELARAYARVHKITEAVQFQDKAIESAKAAKLPQRVIDSLVKSETDWQKAG
jgi:uncharacterized protein YyaL (SSP411 family)